MYKNSRPPRGRFHGNKGRGVNNRRIKTFDPSSIIKNNPTIGQVEAVEQYSPRHSFADFAISEKIKNAIGDRGFVSPTPIQDQAIPEILSGKDVVGVANTGTGKTAAFLIPLIHKVLENPREHVLIVAPTRELAVQIEDELMRFGHRLGIYSTVCIGGVSLYKQIKGLSKNPQFVIGTPGRLLDLSNQRKLRFGQFNTVVLDEVDHMLDMGFIRDVQKIISQIPTNRQSLFFSATVSDSVLNVMQQFTQSPTKISVRQEDNAIYVEQEVVKLNGRVKIEVLQALLDNREFERVLVFGRTKRGAEKLSRDLARKGFRVSAIHGNKSQNQRQKALDLFKKGKVNILIATDVVARGIDVDNVTHVINYELPESYDNYLHRIGRTGRAGKKGKALTFVR